MATSSVPAVKGAILALLQERPALAAVNVSWDQPGTDDLLHEMIFMLDAEFASEEVPFLRPRPHRHREQYTIPVVVWTKAEGDDAQGAEERMWEITGEVEDAIRDNTELGIPGVVLMAVVAGTGKRPHNWMDDAARGSECRVDVQVQADI